jgi:2-polyprenyl-3-methyl-5-hydroxy-6-metoxy-1,4-benzoquinol methylase
VIVAEFDRFAGRYRDILDEGVRASGESSEYFADHKARYVARVLGADFGGKILDYGCGVGLVASALAALMPRAALHGFDPSLESIGRVPREVAARGRFTADAGALDGDYDAVVIANVMHHVAPCERQGTMDALAARLARGGRLVVFEHNPLNPATRWVVSHCPLDDGAVLLRRRETERYLTGAGLTLDRTDYIVFFPRALAALRPLEPRLAWLPLGAQYAVVAHRHG